MSERIPDTEEVRHAYATRMAPVRDTERYAEFDRWLAAHDAEIREQIARDVDYAAESQIEGPEARGIRYAAKVVRQHPTR